VLSGVSHSTLTRFFNELKEAKNEKGLVKYAGIFEKYDIVILDEVGYILSCRFGRKSGKDVPTGDSTLLTLKERNCSFNTWP